MKRLIRLLLLWLPIVAAAQTSLFPDDGGRRALLEISPRLTAVQAILQSANFDPSKVAVADQSRGDIDYSIGSGGDVEARQAIENLRRRLVLLERSVGLRVFPFTQISGAERAIFRRFEDGDLRRAILDFRQRISSAEAVLEGRLRKQPEGATIGGAPPRLDDAQSQLPTCPATGRKHNCFGTEIFPNGNKYVGEFKDDKFDGQGTYTWTNGDRHVGGFKDGKRNGKGTLTWADGTTYVGEFKDDKPAGTASDRPNSTPVNRNAEPPRSTLNLAVTASPPDSNGVLTLNITTRSDTASLRVNGDEIGGRADGRYSVNRFAQIGDNSFEVIATDRFGNTQKQTIAVFRRAADNTVRFASLNPIAVRARPATNAVAIIIGIQDYRRVPKAEFASNDARVFYDYAVRGLGVRPENVKLLVDQEADAIEILSAFNNWLPLKARRGQTDVYVFFSGHGLPSDDGSNLYLLPHGVDRQFLDRTAIKQSELVASLQAVSPRSVTMFMDACYSGQIRTGETLLASARPIAIQAKASSFPPNFSVISASAPDQLASSSPDLKHGIFSYYLMKGMEGEADENRDGNITMAEMQSYLKEFVGKKAMSLSRTQVPQLTGDQSRVLVSR